MDNITPTVKPEYIVDVIMRRRWFILIPFSISMVVGILLEIFLPKSYEARTLILVEAQRVPEEYVQSVVSLDFDARINTISQQILSRTNLEKIIQQYRLYNGPKYDNMFIEDKIADLRKKISVDVTHSSGRRGADSFSVSFRGEDPDVVVQIVNTLAGYFIEENLKVRESQATGTSDFLESELTIRRKKLEDVEENMKEYRRRYMGELPEQLESNLRMLDRIEEQLIERKQRLTEEKNRLISLQSPIDATVQGGTTPAAPGTPGSNSAADLEQMKNQLESLQTKYTDKHPDIIRLKKSIADLTAKLKNEKSDQNSGLEGETGAQLRMQGLSAVQIRQVNEVKAEIKGLETDIKDLKAQQIMYKTRVENTPKREQELMSLRRDYQNIQESYDSLLNRKLESEIAVNMEKKQKGERFRVVDPAQRPEKPVEPNMKKLFLLVFAAGLGLGGGIVFLFEYLDTSFRQIEGAESFLDLPVIATIPTVNHPKDYNLKRLHSLMSIIYMLFSFSLMIVFILIALKGPENILALIQRLS